MQKLINYIKSEWKFLLCLTVLFLILTIRLPYQVYGPGGKIDLSTRFTGEEYKTEGSFNVTYISSYPGTLPILGLSYIIPNWDIVKNDDIKFENETIEEANTRSKILNEVAVSNATYYAYQGAGKDIEILDNKMYVTYIYPTAKTNLKIGDIILSVDGIKYNKSEEIRLYVQSKNEGEKVLFKVNRDGKEIECEGTVSNIEDNLLIGVGFNVVREYKDVNLKYKIKKNEFGPSGGLMMTLYMYNSLTEEDISKGKDIYGTGTIEEDGSVGEIDGIKYKLLGAYKKGAKIFIVPEGNYEEANKVKEENKLDVQLISVLTFSDALIQLKDLK